MMKRICNVILCFSMLLILAACYPSSEASINFGNVSDEISNPTAGSENMQGMLNNTLLSTDGIIHYTYYLPQDYDENKRYPMLMTLPGYSNRFNTIQTTPLTENEYAQKNAEAWTSIAGDMIVVSPNLTDWGEKSARQTIELTDYFIEHFAVDTGRIYAAGFSAGGETLSKAIDMRPELFAAYLHSASQWDGGYEAAAQYKLPIYICMAQRTSITAHKPHK